MTQSSNGDGGRQGDIINSQGAIRIFQFAQSIYLDRNNKELHYETFVWYNMTFFLDLALTR